MNYKEPSLSQSLLHLNANDNVGIVKRAILAGDLLGHYEQDFYSQIDLSMGHKIAVRPIKVGAKVYKYGFPIGVASEDIPLGAHVHLHNIQSNYTIIEDMEKS